MKSIYALKKQPRPHLTPNFSLPGLGKLVTSHPDLTETDCLENVQNN